MKEIKLCDMTQAQYERVMKFKEQHEITDLVVAAKFFWNAQEERFQVAEVITMQSPFFVW